MHNSLQAVETVAYKVILVHAATRMALTIREGSRYRLPRVRIPKWTRPAEEITKAIREQWALSTVVLRIFPAIDAQPACAVAEIMASHISEAYQRFYSCSVEAID